jgi:hypothetical protein
MTTEIIVVCAHCERVLARKPNDDPNETEDRLSHSDCLGFQDKPCKQGFDYHVQVSRDLGYNNLSDYLRHFKRRKIK